MYTSIITLALVASAIFMVLALMPVVGIYINAHYELKYRKARAMREAHTALGVWAVALVLVPAIVTLAAVAGQMLATN